VTITQYFFQKFPISNEETILSILSSVIDAKDVLPLSTPEKNVEYLMVILREIEEALKKNHRNTDPTQF